MAYQLTDGTKGIRLMFHVKGSRTSARAHADVREVGRLLLLLLCCCYCCDKHVLVLGNEVVEERGTRCMQVEGFIVLCRVSRAVEESDRGVG